jgi:hypothetical protein
MSGQASLALRSVRGYPGQDFAKDDIRSCGVQRGFDPRRSRLRRIFPANEQVMSADYVGGFRGCLSRRLILPENQGFDDVAGSSLTRDPP